MWLNLLQLACPLLQPSGDELIWIFSVAASDLLAELFLLGHLRGRLVLVGRQIELLLACLAVRSIQLDDCRAVFVITSWARDGACRETLRVLLVFDPFDYKTSSFSTLSWGYMAILVSILIVCGVLIRPY